MNTYARAGQRVEGRFDLVYPYHHQPSDQASVWIARDVALSRQVRAIMIDPEGPNARAATDAAHRAVLVSDPHLVSIVHVVNDDDRAVITEIPPGRPLSDWLTGTPLPPDQVSAIIGETSSAIATGARRGIRHLQCTGKTIFLTDEGDVIVDGLGLYAALAGADTSKDRASLDRDEACGLTVLTAALLLGRDLPDPADHDATILEALELDVPPVLDSLLRREMDGVGAASAADLTRFLVPWPAIDVATLPGTDVDGSADPFETIIFEEKLPSAPQWPDLKFPPVSAADAVASGTEGAGGDVPERVAPDAGEPAREDAATENAPEEHPAATRDEAAHLVDETLGLDDRGKLTTPIAWPGLGIAGAGAPTVVTRTSTQAIPAATTSHEGGAAHAKPALDDYAAEREKRFDATKVIIALFVVGFLFVAWLGFKHLTAPLDPVTLRDPDSGLEMTSEPTPTAEATTEPAQPAPAPSEPPAIASAELVSPDAGMLQGTDPATQDNPQSVPLAVDGNPETTWKSWTYTTPNMSTMSGIGLFVQLEKEATVKEVTINTVGNTGGNIQIRDTVKDAPSVGKVLAEGPVEGSTTFTLSEPLTATSFVVWITELPLSSTGEPQIIVSELQVK